MIAAVALRQAASLFLGAEVLRADLVESAVGLQVGHALVERLRQYAADIGASAIKWTVLKSNLPAKAFYRSLGGQPDEIWEPWQLKIDP